MYVSSATSLLGGGTQLDFFRNGSNSISSSASNGLKKYSFSLRRLVKSLKSVFNWKVSSRGGLGQNERPFERRLFRSRRAPCVINSLLCVGSHHSLVATTNYPGNFAICSLILPHLVQLFDLLTFHFLISFVNSFRFFLVDFPTNCEQCRLIVMF